MKYIKYSQNTTFNRLYRNNDNKRPREGGF